MPIGEAKLLIYQAVEGSLLEAYSQPGFSPNAIRMIRIASSASATWASAFPNLAMLYLASPTSRS